MIGAAFVRIGEVETAVRVADHIVGAVEAPALVVVDQRLDFAVRVHARDAPVVALAHDQPALQIERGAVAADGGAHQLRLLARRHAKQLVLANIDEIPETVRMPQRSFGKNKAGGKAFGFGGLENVGQVVGCGHGVFPVMTLGWRQAYRLAARNALQKVAG